MHAAKQDWPKILCIWRTIQLAVDTSGNPYAVWDYVDPASGLLRLHLAVAVAANGVFCAAQQVDDVDANGGARHPSVGFAPNGDFVVAWVDGDGR